MVEAEALGFVHHNGCALVRAGGPTAPRCHARTAWFCARRGCPVTLLPWRCHLSVWRPRAGARVGLARRVHSATIRGAPVLWLASCLGGGSVATTIDELLRCLLARGGGGGDALPWAPRDLFPARELGCDCVAALARAVGCDCGCAYVRVSPTAMSPCAPPSARRCQQLQWRCVRRDAHRRLAAGAGRRAFPRCGGSRGASAHRGIGEEDARLREIGDTSIRLKSSILAALPSSLLASSSALLLSSLLRSDWN